MGTYRFTRRAVVAALAGGVLPPVGARAAVDGSTDISGAGASFPSRVYARWAEAYGRLHGATLNYRPTGSGDGVRQAIARSVALAGTDSPLAAEELSRNRLVQLPTLVGGVTPVVNLPGVDGGRLRLSGPVLAELMMGRIERWDDPALAALNPGLSLPARRVLRVVRAERSGTTEGFSRYLQQVHAPFASVGAGPLPAWPGDPLRAEGNDGVAQRVREQPGSIGYVSADRAGEGLQAVWLRNREGAWVKASEAGFRAAILASDLHRSGNDRGSLLDQTGPETWPITQASFVLVDAAPARAAQVEPVMQFLYWCLLRGDALFRGTGFAPLPVAVQARLAGRLAQVRPRDGRLPVYQVF